jgi:hypothetical protein
MPERSSVIAFPRHVAEQAWLRSFQSLPSANPVPVAARNLGSLSRRFDILLQSRALVTERHPVLADFARVTMPIRNAY